MFYPLDERHNNAVDYEKYLVHDRFHHSDKGCEVKMIYEKHGKHTSIQKVCHIHNVVCSKTGWGLGWYGGTKSLSMTEREANPLVEKSCVFCGEKFKSLAYNAKKCPKCRNIKIVFRPILNNNSACV